MLYHQCDNTDEVVASEKKRKSVAQTLRREQLRSATAVATPQVKARLQVAQSSYDCQFEKMASKHRSYSCVVDALTNEVFDSLCPPPEDARLLDKSYSLPALANEPVYSDAATPTCLLGTRAAPIDV